MSTGWEQSKRESDRYIHQIKGILGQTLIGEPPIEEDQKRNTDLIVLRMDPVRIACRVRGSKYNQPRYVGEFTIRISRPSGTKTELAKIIEGWGDYFFYGFQDRTGAMVENWIVGDLAQFRAWWSREWYRTRGDMDEMPGFVKPNFDGSSEFRVFRWDEIPYFVVATDIGQRRAA